jgi:sulfoxide reductase heme-binding subunit YedZ
MAAGGKDGAMGGLAFWRDQAGRVSALKLAAFAVLLAPALWLVLRFLGGDLGGRPLTEVIHRTGDWTVRFLLATLAVTPLRVVWDWPRVVQLRRMLGVGAACYAGVHLLFYVFDQNLRIGVVAREIVLRFYLTIGFVALLGLLALAVTSTDGWQRRLRGGWKRLHRLVFPVAVLALFHYFLQSKADVTAAVFATGVFAWLGFWRLAPRRWQSGLALPALLAVAAPLAAALAEAGWYAAATGVRASLVLRANLDPAMMRPAQEILVLAVLVLAVAALRRLFRRRPAAGRAGMARPAQTASRV